MQNTFAPPERFGPTAASAMLLERDGRVVLVSAPLRGSTGPLAGPGPGVKLWDWDGWRHEPEQRRQVREAVLAAAAGETPRLEVIVARADGTRGPIELSITPMLDASGAALQLLATISDPGPRRLQDAELERSEQRFQQVVESAADGLVMVDERGLMVLVNRATEQMFGFSREQILGQPVEMLMPERHRGSHPELLAGFIRDPEPRAMAARRELFARRRDGSEFPVEIGLNPICTVSGVRVLATIQDVTTRKAYRELIERALAEKTALLNEIHHRVKNSLQVIASVLNLQARSSSPEVAQALAESQGRVKAMALIHQLLYEDNDFSQVSLARYLRKLCGLMRETFQHGRGRIRLRTEIPDSGLKLDLQRAIPCGLIVNELITNALRHAFPEPRNGTITVSLGEAPDGAPMLAVADDGIGLPPEIGPNSGGSLGFRLISLLAEQARGRLNIARTGGTRIELILQAPAAEPGP